MQQAVKDRRDDDLVMKEFGPVGECLIGGQNRAGLLVSVGYEAEKEIALLAVDGRVAHFIDDHESGFVIASPPAGTACLVIFLELPDEVLHGGKVHA